MKKTCFVVCPIGNDNSPVREHSNRVWEMIIKGALHESSWDVLRADRLPDTGEKITTAILEKLETADFCLVDITGLNPNVMFEMGIRYIHGISLMVIAEKGTVIPFDIHDIRVVTYDLVDTQSVVSAVKAISERAYGVYSQERTAVLKLGKAEPKTVVTAREMEIVNTLTCQLNAILNADAAWEKNKEGKWDRIEFRYAFGMHWRDWEEPASSHSDNAKSEDRGRWPGHKKAQLSRDQIAEYGFNWPGVVYQVTPKLCVASRLIQEYSLLVYHIARCLHHGVISPESARFFWRAIDLAFPVQLLQEPLETHEYETGFWRWVEFMVFSNTADRRLIEAPSEKLLPWVELYGVIKKGKHLIDHGAKKKS